MAKHLLIALCALLALTPVAVSGESSKEQEKAQKVHDKRRAIDGMAVDAMTRLFKESERAGELYDDAVGYAVFDNFKVAFLLSGGGGVGVAVDKATNQRTYMKMGTGGIGLGIGGQSYLVVFLFEDRGAFDRFPDKGWQADASANAVAGTKGKNADASFSNGLAVFQMTHKGLMAQADISGTKYWKHKKLNRN
jgi:lipid-binding SYLF domain-containing protein